jgi:hypothetical protein
MQKEIISLQQFFVLSSKYDKEKENFATIEY